MWQVERVDAPPAPPARAGSLLGAAHTPTERLTREHMEHGFWAAACSGWDVLAPPCPPPEVPIVNHSPGGDPGPGEFVSGMPFYVRTEETCSTHGLDPDELARRADTRLDQVFSAAVAHELWTGESAAAAAGEDDESPWRNNRRLAAPVGGAALPWGQPTDLTPGVDAVAPSYGLALLEDALGAMLGGATGVIHATPAAATVLARPAGLRRDGQLILTVTDNRVVADPGYPGTGPGGTTPDAGETWLYGTARPTVRQGATDVPIPPDLARALNRDDNTVTYRARRPAWVSFPCGVLAVRITLDPPLHIVTDGGN